LAAVAIEATKFLFELHTNITANTPPFSVNDGSAFLLHLFLLQNIVGHELTWNIPSWSISAEFYTYILFALMVWLFRNRTAFRYLLTALVMGIAAAGILRHGMDSAEYGVYRCLFSFFLGALTYELEARLRRPLLPAHLAPWIAGASLFILVAFIANADILPAVVQLLFPLLCGLSIMLLGTCTPQTWLIRLLEMRGLVFLGTVSYGIYMIHTIIWWFIKQVLRFIWHIPTVTTADGSSIMPINNLVLATGVHLAGLCLIVLIAYLSYRWLEQPLIQRFK
jgi:peptidoglycan/LPS O-acetylase OafA/YrhL